MDENNLDKQNPSGGDQQDNTPMIDKLMQKNPFIKPGAAKYENAQTQSMIMTAREEASAQLAAANAQNAEMLRQQKRAEDAVKAKRTGVYIVLVIVILAIVGALGWLIFNVVISGQKTVSKSNSTGNTTQEKKKHEKVEGYKCNSEECEKAADISDNLVLVHDGGHYYLFDKEKEATTLTAIPEQEYHAMVPFVWGGKTYLSITPESSPSALFSVTDNRQVTEFVYNKFFTDIKSDEYKDMAWVEGKYIVAKANNNYRLVQLSSGKDVVQASKRVFANGDYFFAYEAGQNVHVYAGGKQIYVATTGKHLYVYEKLLVVADKEGEYFVLQQNGEYAENETVDIYLSEIEPEKLITTLDSNSKYFNVPVAE